MSDSTLTLLTLIVTSCLVPLCGAMVYYIKKRADKLETKSDVNSIKIDHNTRMTLDGTDRAATNAKIAADTATDAKEAATTAADKITDVVNGALTDKIKAVVSETVADLNERISRHAEANNQQQILLQEKLAKLTKLMEGR